MAKPRYPEQPVLLVDDESQFLFSVRLALSSAGITNTIECNDSRDAERLIGEHSVGVILLDLNMPHITGLELLPRISQEHPNLIITVMTAVNDVDTAVGCMRNGAFDYLVKPIDNERLITHVRRAIRQAEIQRENVLLKEHLLSDTVKYPEFFSHIVTRNHKMRSIFQYIESIAGTSLPVLITGETGTGKELFAEATHRVSRRPGKFVIVNVAGVDDTLFSDTLFGHRKGAFTGADTERRGLIEEATGGTLFLDEIGDLAVESQVKLLRLLQEHTYYTLGSDTPKRSDARIIVATNRDLRAMQESGEFRKDLFYRLQAHHIKLPPLRERMDDLSLLVEHLLEKAAGDMSKKKPSAPRELMMLLGTYSFPGNVRELEGMVYDAVSRHESGVLSTQSFREKILPAGGGLEFFESIAGAAERIKFPETLPTLHDLEEMLIDEAMERSGGNQTIAAELLGISRNTLNSRLKRTKT
jgi:DNA-binding NtrC family response regulator